MNILRLLKCVQAYIYKISSNKPGIVKKLRKALQKPDFMRQSNKSVGKECSLFAIGDRGPTENVEVVKKSSKSSERGMRFGFILR